jgi:hypothetical protein
MEAAGRFRGAADLLRAAARGVAPTLFSSTGIFLATPSLAQTAAQTSPAEVQDRAKASEAAPPQILDLDGNPLPAELQEELRRQLRDNPQEPKAPAPPAVQDTASTVQAGADDGQILVSARRPRGSVQTETVPERIFSPIDIAAYGANNVGELLDRLGAQVKSNQSGRDGRPVTLLNGRRVSSFTEIAEIPAEAIERMEVFPEQLAIKFGYRADQKVVNVVTFEKFRSELAQLSLALPSDGGYRSGSVLANYFAIRGNSRLDFGAEYNRSTALLESNRDLDQLGSVEGSGRSRTLLPETERLALSGLVSTALASGIAATLNGRYETNALADQLGRDADGPLHRDTNIENAHLGTTLSGAVGKWLWTFTANYDRLNTKVETDVPTLADVREHANSQNVSGNANLLLSGALFTLPAGPISTTVTAKFEARDYSADWQRGALAQGADLSRDSGGGQVTLGVPIARRRGKQGAGVGNLSLNLNLAFERYSDFEARHSFGYGLSWSPFRALNFTASVATEQQVPTMERLGAPLLVSPNVRTFDFARREVVDITQISGGNPGLRPDERRLFRLSMNATPLDGTDLTFSLDYVSTRVEDPIVEFLLATPEIEAAFPKRFTRDPSGRLSQVDSRPLNFRRSEAEQIRWGVNFVKPLDATEPWMRAAPVRVYADEAEARAAAPTGSIVTMVQPGSAMARRLDNMTSRLSFSLYHSWQLRDQLQIREGMPELDLLDGGAIEPRGGRRRHSIELQAGVFKRGLGARITGNWQSGTTVRGSAGAGETLEFEDLATFNLNLFANLADSFGGSKPPGWIKNARITFSVTNLLNTRPQVRDARGATPISYQPSYLDPLGRVMSIGLRKVF